MLEKAKRGYVLANAKFCQFVGRIFLFISAFFMKVSIWIDPVFFEEFQVDELEEED